MLSHPGSLGRIEPAQSPVCFMMLSKAPSAILAFVCVLAFAITGFADIGTARAQEKGVLTAVSYQPLGTVDVFDVQTLDNARENLALVKRMKDALRQRGHGVQDGARLIMTVDANAEPGAISSSSRYYMSITKDMGPNTEDRTQMRFNLFDSQKGALLNEGSENNQAIKPAQYGLEVRIEDRTNGRQLWEGRASAELLQSGGLELLLKLVPPLADAIGQTASEKPIVLQ